MWDINFATTLINQEETIIISYLLISHKILYVAFLLFITYSQQSPVGVGRGFGKPFQLAILTIVYCICRTAVFFRACKVFIFNLAPFQISKTELTQTQSTFPIPLSTTTPFHHQLLSLAKFQFSTIFSTFLFRRGQRCVWAMCKAGSVAPTANVNNNSINYKPTASLAS